MHTEPNPARAFRLIVTGGGTGGHTYPALTALRTLQARLAAAGRALDVLWVGTADGLEARVAAAEGIAFEAVATGKLVTGNPVRQAVLAGQGDKAVDALGLHGFDRALPTVFVTGGAQGSQQINTRVSGILPWLLAHANVIHQCGPANLTDLRHRAADLPGPLAARYFASCCVTATASTASPSTPPSRPRRWRSSRVRRERPG